MSNSFQEHLRQTRKTVEGWPLWKQQALGDYKTEYGVTEEAVATYECTVACCRCGVQYSEDKDSCPQCGQRGCA